MTKPALFVLLFLIATMLSSGMVSGTAALRALFRSPGFLTRTLGANFVLAPLLGVALARVLPLSPAAAAALIVLGCTPGGLSAVNFTSKVGGGAARAAATFVLLSLLAILVSPALLRLALPAASELAIPYGRVFLFLVVSTYLPLGIGLLLCDRAPGMAAKLAKPLGLAGTVAFIGFMYVTKAFKKEAVASIGGPAVGALLLFVLGTMILGWLVGGPDRESRRILASATSMRNAALCLAIAQNTPASSAVIMPLLAFSLLMVPPNMLFTVGFNMYNKAAARKTGAPKR